MRTPVRIVLVDDHRLVCELLAGALDAEPDFQVIARCADGAEALAQIGRHRPQVAVVDHRLPDGLPGLEVCAEVRQRSPDTHCVLITTFPKRATVEDAIAVGVTAVATKRSDTSVLRRAVRAAARGELFVDPLLQPILIDAALGGARGTRPGQLTAPERRVLALLPSGLTTAEMAQRLEVGAETVKSHVGHVLEKLDARNRAQAIAKAMERGLL